MKVCGVLVIRVIRRNNVFGIFILFGNLKLKDGAVSMAVWFGSASVCSVARFASATTRT